MVVLITSVASGHILFWRFKWRDNPSRACWGQWRWKIWRRGVFAATKLIGNKHTMVVINEGPGRNRRQQSSHINNDVCGCSDQKSRSPCALRESRQVYKYAEVWMRGKEIKKRKDERCFFQFYDWIFCFKIWERKRRGMQDRDGGR